MIKKRWIAASAVAAMLALSSHGALAQMSSSGDMGMSMSGGIDYSVLAKPHAYNYMSLKQAKAAGYSDSQIATMVIIADKSDRSLTEIRSDVQRGMTFPVLASMLGVRLNYLYNVDDTKAEIANYMMAYEHTGKSGMMMSSDMSAMAPMEPMSTPTTTMAPPMAPSTPAMAMAPAAGSADIVDTAMAAGDFKTLVRLVKAAGLVDTLKGPGPFTVFAPTDAAFRKLPKGTIKMLMADPDKLKKILTYHVIPAKVSAADAMAMTSPTSPPTVEGDTLQVTTADGKVMINGSATVTQADIQCTNGVIHSIDTVLMPPGS